MSMQCALSIAITNNPRSPLAAASAHCIDIQAGVEASVAATKTFVTSIIAGLLLLAEWRGDTALLNAVKRFPEQAQDAISCDWDILSDRLISEDSMLVLGRGPAMAIASEAALKFKETCQIHAEAYSSAEVMHGPVSIVGAGFPVLALIARDAAEANISSMAERLAAEGADVFGTGGSLQRSRRLPFTASGHPLTDPVLLIVTFYSFIEKLARRRGLDPDVPPNLRKVTETV
jgi:glutamine---fructose-6-phosphate transaminase (isomerizing)